jgi:ABC-type transporter Mla maintaining outer membrane lipid asymmetry ATPase subunit MlaF
MIEVSNLSFSIDNESILAGVSVQFAQGSLTGILAAVEDRIAYLLKIICGITEPDAGKVIVDGTDLLNASAEKLLEIRRNISFVFDRGGLLSNLSIRENLLLPMDYLMPELNKTTKLEKIHHLFAHFGLPEGILKERPARLHPQFLKMILLIRAFLTEPRIILYDNPLGDLEISFRKKIFAHIATLHGEGVTQLFVSTSDILFEMADVNLVFSAGKIIESGPWDDLLINPHPVTKKIIKEYLEVGINET